MNNDKEDHVLLDNQS